MRSVKVAIVMTRDDGVEVRHTFEVSSGVPVVIDGTLDDELEIDESEANERIATHLNAALTAERIGEWLDELDELP